MTLADIRSRTRPKHPPVLDADFTPAALYNRAFHEEIHRSGQSEDLVFGLERAVD